MSILQEPYQVLEERLAEWCGMPHVAACSSGTAALHLALECLGLKAGSAVILPDFTMIACARAVTLAGLIPVFVDCDPKTLLMDLDLVDDTCKNAGKHVSAVMAVHIYGRQVNMSELHGLSAKYGFKVVEDMAELHGAHPHGMTHAACWSFYKNKIVAGEEGGAVAFKDRENCELAWCLRSLGFTPAHDFNHVPRGHNYRMSNVHAGLVSASLSAFHTNMLNRFMAVNWYDAWCPDAWKMPPRMSPWVYDIRVPGLTMLEQEAAVRSLNKAGVQARIGFRPMSAQQEYRQTGHRRPANKNAHAASKEVFYLPVTPGVVNKESVELTRSVVMRTIGHHSTA